MARDVQPNLDRDQLVAAAFAVLEETGLDGLSMRRVASRLGVKAPALYWHIDDKGELLGLMAREIYRAAAQASPAEADWPGWLVGFGRSLRASFAGHRDGARLCASAHPPPGSDLQPTQITARLMSYGLGEAAALSFQASVISLALGWATFEANGPMRAYLGGMMDIDHNFEEGIQALVRGFAESSRRPFG